MTSIASTTTQRPKQTKEEKEEWDSLRNKTSYSEIFVKSHATDEEIQKISEMRQRIGDDV